MDRKGNLITVVQQYEWGGGIKLSSPIGYEVGNPGKVAGYCVLHFPYLEKLISEMFRIRGCYGSMKSLTKKGNE